MWPFNIITFFHLDTRTPYRRVLTTTVVAMETSEVPVSSLGEVSPRLSPELRLGTPPTSDMSLSHTRVSSTVYSILFDSFSHSPSCGTLYPLISRVKDRPEVPGPWESGDTYSVVWFPFYTILHQCDGLDGCTGKWVVNRYEMYNE